jgi:WXG100 family type VII secretion target
MPAPQIRAQHEQLQRIQQQFGAESQATGDQLRNLRQHLDLLKGGGWKGQAATRFFGEMDGSILPSVSRLVKALEQAGQVTGRIAARMRQCETDAAAVLVDRTELNVPAGAGQAAAGPGDEAAGGAGGSGNVEASPLPGGAPTGAPPHRIYVVNGINNQGQGLPEIQQYLIDRGYPADQVQLTAPVYDTNLQDLVGDWRGTQWQGTDTGFAPLDWLTDRAARGTNWLTDRIANGAERFSRGVLAGANTILGSGQVATEYITGGSTQTQRVYASIQEDLANNPLAPGQQVLIIAHSGGGAIASNLAPRLERDGVDVAGITTIGSPIVNADVAGQYGRVVDVVDRNDPVVNYGALDWRIRSNESRTGLASAFALLGAGRPGLALSTAAGTIVADPGNRDGTNYQAYNIDTRANGGEGGHSSYHTSNELAQILNDQFGLGLKTR